MTIRRFRLGTTEGVEFADGRVVINTRPAPLTYPSVAAAEDALGSLDWIDGARPVFSPLAIASIVLPEVLGDPQEFVRLLTWLTRVNTPFWTPPVVIGLCQLVQPHVKVACPWLPEASRRWERVESPVDAEPARLDYERWLLDTYPGPWSVEPLTPREYQRRYAALRVAAARPWPDADLIGPLHRSF